LSIIRQSIQKEIFVTADKEFQLIRQLAGIMKKRDSSEDRFADLTIEEASHLLLILVKSWSSNHSVLPPKERAAAVQRVEDIIGDLVVALQVAESISAPHLLPNILTCILLLVRRFSKSGTK
jgi:hypothetical protein